MNIVFHVIVEWELSDGNPEVLQISALSMARCGHGMGWHHTSLDLSRSFCATSLARKFYEDDSLLVLWDLLSMFE